MRNRVIEMLSVLAMFSVAAAVETPLNIPLTIWDVAGVERKQEICSQDYLYPADCSRNRKTSPSLMQRESRCRHNLLFWNDGDMQAKAAVIFRFVGCW